MANVRFVNSKSLEGSVSESKTGTLYFPTDEDCIILNGREVANNVMSGDEADLIRLNVLPEQFLDITAYDSMDVLKEEAASFITLASSFAKRSDKSISSTTAATIVLHGISGGQKVNIISDKSDWTTSGNAYLVSIIAREGRYQAKFECRNDSMGDLVISVPASARIFSISLYTNTDAVHERIDALMAISDALGKAIDEKVLSFPDLTTMKMSEYNALADKNPNMLYFLYDDEE